MDAKTFDVLGAVKGRTYPSDSVTVYTDVAALYAYTELNELANDAPEGTEADALYDALKPMREAIEASALTFHMRGFSPAVRTSINDEAKAKFGEDADLDDGEPYAWRMSKYLAESIIKVVNVAGAVDEHRWAVEDIETLKGYLAEEEFMKLTLLMLKLSFDAWKFDSAVTADF